MDGRVITYALALSKLKLSAQPLIPQWRKLHYPRSRRPFRHRREYFVAAQLSRLGYVASINLKNTRGVDILVMNEAAMDSVTIQVKTKQGSVREWILTKRPKRSPTPSSFTSSSTCMAPMGIRITSSSRVQWSRPHVVRLTAIGLQSRVERDHIRTIAFANSVMQGHYKDRWDALGI